MADRLDLLLLGATGFTGIHCIPYIHKLSKSNGRNLTWGVAGRSEEKLKQALEKVGKEIGRYRHKRSKNLELFVRFQISFPIKYVFNLMNG